jgi:hypothetical protein
MLPPAGTAVMQARGSYVSAIQVQRKRELADVQKRLLEEANLMGESAFYGWGAGDNRIEGPSEAIAFAAARCWGNCAVEYAPVEETRDAYIFTATFIDLETGFTLQRPFRQSKRWTVSGRMDEMRKEDVRFQIGATKAARNVILKTLPAWLIDAALEQAKSGVRKKIEGFIAAKGLPAAQDLIVSELAKLGVKEEAILRKFSVAKRDGLDLDKLVILRGDLKAIQSGQERPEVLFPVAGAEPTPGKAPADLDSFGAPERASAPESLEAPSAGATAGGPALITAERAASIRATAAERGLDADEISSEISGSGLESTPASFETSILAAIEKAAKKGSKK